ncbi:hypothetical protein JOF56_010528 [Kibdelosporangium banguiense]|uniref:non-specific serine/threonine protein kinase n=1 Tax=Kibdelosporangium banguiense TaxID=1365924 RepID=A0ABS4U1P9_9PSEU|nr:serine/threonine-protein kinase [Kibdelosporangium banguiense]MBP2330143.1 hypothetical protein [Kibdelosporangium banguiense]
MIDELLAVLANAGVTPDADELRDALWLADHVAVEPSGEPVVMALSAEPEAIQPPEETGEPAADPPHHEAPGGGLYIGAPGGPPRVLGQPDRVQGIAVQRARAVRPARQIEIARALRPFGRRVPARTRFVLDENATVTRIADEGVWSPVLRPDTERWLNLTLVVDPSPTMAIWRDRIRQFRMTTERLGLFRLIRERPIDRILTEPANRQAVLLITDGISDDWRTGKMLALLEKWGSTRPVAVCNVLPPQMWPGTGIQVVRGQARSWNPGAPNRSWTVHTGGTIPVVRFSAPWLASWAKVVAGTSSWTPVALLTPPMATSAPDVVLEPREVVERYRLGASPQAFRLACLLSAAWLTLPVMQFVRDVMLPDADDGDLTQVLLGGLLKRSDALDLPVDPDNARYDFLLGVREHLLGYLQRRDLLTVVQETNKFVASQARQGFDITALLADPEQALRGGATIDQGSPLHVAIVVLAQLGGRYRKLLAALPDQPGTPVNRPDDTHSVQLTTDPDPFGDLGVPKLIANRYELVTKLSTGDVSVVYRAFDTGLRRSVAIKILRADLAHNSHTQQQFRRSAILAAKVRHPAIAAVHEIAETPTSSGLLPFIAMEYVDGRTLADIVETDGPLDGLLAMEVAASVCEAVTAIHQKDLMHDAVSPANVMLTRSNAIKLVGFSTARPFDRSTAGNTKPDQWRASADDVAARKADLQYQVQAIGSLLYKLLTGEEPYGTHSGTARPKHRLLEPAQPRQLNPAINRYLEAITMKALTNWPKERYQSPDAMRSDIARLLEGKPPPLAKPLPPPRARLLSRPRPSMWPGLGGQE